VRILTGEVPILGVCLGHQAIGEAFGATVSASGHPMHGRASVLEHLGQGLFEGVAEGIEVGRYHSLVIEPETLPDELVVDAWSDGFIMAIRHRFMPVYGVQFHPESVLTPTGYELFERFLK